MDLSKGAIPDNRHRALTHTSWFLSTVLERVFGVTIVNSEGKHVSVRDVGETHIIEDFGDFIPTAQDYLGEMEYKPWMEGRKGGHPPSYQKIESSHKVTRKTLRWDKD